MIEVCKKCLIGEGVPVSAQAFLTHIYSNERCMDAASEKTPRPCVGRARRFILY